MKIPREGLREELFHALVEELAANGHVHLIKGVLQDVVRVELVDRAQLLGYIFACKARNREEFHLREGLDAVDPELVGVHHGDVGGPKKA